MAEQFIKRYRGGRWLEVRLRDIPGLPGYAACEDGSIWSNRPGGRKTASTEVIDGWKFLSIYRRPYGHRYCVVCFRPEPNGKVVCRYVHRLVLETFVGPCPDGTEVRHADNNTANNRLDNLSWGTRKANMGDCIPHGTRRRGSNTHSKRSEMDILAVHILHRFGFSQNAIASLAYLSQSEIKNVLTGHAWPHVLRVYEAMKTLLKASRQMNLDTEEEPVSEQNEQ